MNSFASLFKKMYFQNEKNFDEITNKLIHNKLITLLENNVLDEIDDWDFINQEKLENDIALIANGLMTESLDENEEIRKNNY